MVSEYEGHERAQQRDTFDHTWVERLIGTALVASDSTSNGAGAPYVQVERFSTRLPAGAPPLGSYASIAFSTSATVTAVPPASQRSSTARSRTGTAAPRVKPSSLVVGEEP